jgi:hypothetical protein
VRGRLHHDALDVCVIRGELLQHRGQMIGSTSLRDHLVLLIESHDDTVVCMQINSAV